MAAIYSMKHNQRQYLKQRIFGKNTVSAYACGRVYVRLVCSCPLVRLIVCLSLCLSNSVCACFRVSATPPGPNIKPWIVFRLHRPFISWPGPKGLKKKLFNWHSGNHRYGLLDEVGRGKSGNTILQHLFSSASPAKCVRRYFAEGEEGQKLEGRR